MWSLFDGQDILDEVDPAFSENIRRHVDRVVRLDPFHVSANTYPKGDRSKRPQEQDPDSRSQATGTAHISKGIDAVPPESLRVFPRGAQAAGQPRLVHVKSAVSSVCEQSVLLGPVQRQVRSPRELVFVEALGHARLPLAAYRLDHRARVELTAIDPHPAAEAAADIEGGFDNDVAGVTRRRVSLIDCSARSGYTNR
jgi:hypothetical protein